MVEIDLRFLGRCIFDARKKCGLTQRELAEQTGLTPKTIGKIEKGDKNPTYGTLLRLIIRLGISPNTLFPTSIAIECEDLQHFIWKFQFCKPQDQKILLNILDFLAEQLLERERGSERPD